MSETLPAVTVPPSKFYSYDFIPDLAHPTHSSGCSRNGQAKDIAKTRRKQKADEGVGRRLTVADSSELP